MTEPATPDPKPGLLDRFRSRWHWFDHVWRAQERYNDSKGDFYAAGITYFTIFALFPLLMVGFATAGFFLASQPRLLTGLENRIKTTITGDFGQQLVNLMDAAIASRSTVGIIGLATAAWAGLGWINNLREALSQMWGSRRREPGSYLKRKRSDVLAMLSVFVAIVVTVALTALGNTSVMETLLNWIGIRDSSALSVILTVVSRVMSLLVSWLLFSWMIARLPRESVTLRSSVRAGLIAAVGFEIFKQLGSVYLSAVVTGPAGATFGPVLGLMVFAYVTARLLLFATAWAATSRDNLAAQPEESVVAPPPPAIINNRVITNPTLGWAQAAAVAIAGAFGGLGLSRLLRR